MRLHDLMRKCQNPGGPTGLPGLPMVTALQKSPNQVWENYSQYWKGGSNLRLNLEVWKLKIQHGCELISNIPSRGRGWWAWKTVFYLDNFFWLRLIHDIGKKIKKWPEPNIFLHPKIIPIMPFNHTKIFLKMYCIFTLFSHCPKLLPPFHYLKQDNKVYLMRILVNTVAADN